MKIKKILTLIEYNYLIIKERYKANSPIFFKRLKQLSINITVGCVAVITVNASLGLSLPASLITILTYIIALGVGVYGTSILTKE